MNDPNEKQYWQGNTLNENLRDDLRKFESRYRIIVYQNGMTLINHRNFQIAIFSFITFCAIVIAYTGSHAPYSYMISFLVIVLQWYSFYLYDKLRVKIKAVSNEQNALDYFRQKRDLLSDVNYLRKITLGNIALYFICIWASRSPERLFDFSAIASLTFIGIMVVAVVVHYRINVTPVVNFMNKLVSHLEEETGDKELRSAL
jgi:hypothetical protein